MRRDLRVPGGISFTGSCWGAAGLVLSHGGVNAMRKRSVIVGAMNAARFVASLSDLRVVWRSHDHHGAPLGHNRRPTAPSASSSEARLEYAGLMRAHDVCGSEGYDALQCGPCVRTGAVRTCRPDY
jgi:hypothetical protein